jgi:hypothetical protein
MDFHNSITLVLLNLRLQVLPKNTRDHRAVVPTFSLYSERVASRIRSEYVATPTNTSGHGGFAAAMRPHGTIASEDAYWYSERIHWNTLSVA